MHLGRRGRLAVRLWTLLGVGAASVGCQTTPAHRVAPPPAVAARAEKAKPWAGWLASRKTEKKDTRGRSAGGWRPAQRPGAEGGVVPVGYPVRAAPEQTAAGPVLEPPPAEGAAAPAGEPPFAASGDLPAPRLVPIPASPAPRAVAHTIVGPIAGQTPHELAKKALPAYRVEPPDILLVEILGAKPVPDADDAGTNGKGAKDKEKPKDAKEKDGSGGTGADALNAIQPVRGPHLVRPDGTIGLGVYGSVLVAGLTLEEIRDAVANHITATRVPVDRREVSVDVISYNSKFYYVITDGGGLGEPITQLPFQGSETVLDALARVGGLPAVSDKTKIWVSRRGPGDAGQQLPVDYVGIAQRGGAATNYQIMPGDRVYVKADHWVKFDTELSKRLTPLERLFGLTLLGSETVNSIRGRGTSR